MRRKSLLSGSIIVIATTTLLISEWRAQSQPSSVQYESRRPATIQKEVYYTNPVISEPEQTSEDDDYKSITVTPTPIIVGERELVSISSSDLKIEKKKEIKKKVEKPKYSFTDDEIRLLQKLVEAETTDKDIKSKENVTSTIINRVNSNKFPDDIESVIYQRQQFSSVWDGRMDELETTKSTIKAVHNVLYKGTTHNCLYFFSMKDITSESIKSWINNKLVFVFKDEAGHSYYNEK